MYEIRKKNNGTGHSLFDDLYFVRKELNSNGRF